MNKQQLARYTEDLTIMLKFEKEQTIFNLTNYYKVTK